MDRFLIAPLDKGLQTDTRPWLVPDEAFARFNNAYTFRSRVRKRFGANFMQGTTPPSAGYEQIQSRLRINIGTTDGAGNLAGFVPGTKFKIGQMFSIGENLFTVNLAGAVQPMLKTNPAVVTATYSTTNGAYNFVGAAALTAAYFYPAEPVMGMCQYENQSINDEPSIAFDTQFAYQYTTTGWERLATGTDTWTGNNAQFFWTTTYKGNQSYDRLLYVTNYNQTDGIRYWNGATWTTPTFYITAAHTDYIMTARIVLPFKDRLILLNTVENIAAAPQTFVNRCRFSQNGSPIDATAWEQDTPGKGSFIDCPTAEAIVTAEFVKDRLIVFFERSTWELAYTGNQTLPFVWQQINTELGAESTFSVIPYNNVAFGVGNVGIIQCNGSNVERIDEKIPDEVFKIKNGSDGVQRVYGIRDYELEMVYWTFPSGSSTGTYPDRVLVYNYRNKSWAFNDDSITCFGYYQLVTGITWGSASDTWEDADFEWNAGSYIAKAINIIAGNQEGFTFIIRPGHPRNAPALQISNISLTATNATLTVIDNNFKGGDYILIESAQGVTNFNGKIFQVQSGVSSTSIPIIAQDGFPFSGIYRGGGVITRISRIDIWTKQYNFYVSQAKNASVNKVDFMIDRTAAGSITVDAFASSSDLSLVTEGAASGALVGTNVLDTAPYALYPFEQQQTRLWHPVYFQANGECIQFRIYFSDEQMVNPNASTEDFQLHAFAIFAQASSARLE